MKINKSFTLLSMAVGLVGIVASSCSDDFTYEGSGQLRMKMIVNSEVTRAEVEEDDLASKCTIFISSEKGLIHKFEGLDNVPTDLWLKSGRYVAEAWTGDSVSASFDKKFYRAYEPFEIHQGVNNVVLNCKIANVVASVNRDRISNEMLPAFTVTVANTRGELVFDSDNINDAHGYFMMPTGDTELKYTITGKNIVGTEFTKSGVIADVKRAHEYVLNLNYNPDANPYDVGGAFITVAVDDNELLIEDNIVIDALPQLVGHGTDITMPLAGAKGSFGDVILAGACFGEFSKIGVSVSDKDAFGLDYAEYDLTNLAESVRDDLLNKGLSWSYGLKGSDSQLRMKIPAQWLNHLDNGSYTITVSLVDGKGRQKDYAISIEVSDAAMLLLPIDRASITSYTAVVGATVVKDDVSNPAIHYRKKGDSSWTEAPVATRAYDITARLTGLLPATTYEVQPYADGFTGGEIQEFTTEAAFVIPNASFEDWSTYTFGGKSGIPFPGTGDNPTFWSSGNAGSMTMNKAVTTSSTDMSHSGQYSIRLATQFVGVGSLGKMAAGNVFAGDYARTDGTDGELKWGREIPTCHPVMLSGWANYRPQTIQWNSNGGPLTVNSDMDKGTVYVAITTQKVDVKTKSKVFFDKDADYVLGYGEVIWDKNFGADGQLQYFEMPITWKNRNYNGQMYLIIVASSSKYGDYFNGGPSVMYLDDLQLSYE